MGKLEMLPIDLLPWEDFEKLQWRILRDVEGLRHARLYGDRGQKQSGLDVVALTPGHDGVALQSKRYKSFGPAALEAAVRKFQKDERPFDIARLIVGVSREVNSTGVVERLQTLREELQPIELDLWDKREISQLLRGHPEVVIEFFGEQTAERFCAPFTVTRQKVPPREAVAVKEAIARTPESSTGASILLDEANGCADEDPNRAINLIEEAQKTLRDAGFPGHAASHEDLRRGLLVRIGRGAEAGRVLLDDVWEALDRGRLTTAQSAHHRLGELARSAATDTPVSGVVAELARVADAALSLILNPLAYVPPVDSMEKGAALDHARLLVLSGETALAADEQEWLYSAVAPLAAAADTLGDDQLALRTRLRLLVADGTDDWVEVLEEARKGRLGHAMGGLVNARYARRCATHQQFDEADTQWDEAVGDACLAQHRQDASKWVFSRRAFRTRWKPFTSDELLPMEVALSGMGPSERLLPVDDDAMQDAQHSLLTDKLRPAAISAQRALKDAVMTGNWPEETQARRLLGDILKRSNEPRLAAHHYARAGDTNGIKDLVSAQSSHFIDNTSDLDASNYWTVGTAFQLIAAQADLVPDESVEAIAERALEVLANSQQGTLVDLYGFATSTFQNAIRALGGLSDRLTLVQAGRILTYFEEQPDVEPGHCTVPAWAS